MRSLDQRTSTSRSATADAHLDSTLQTKRILTAAFSCYAMVMRPGVRGEGCCPAVGHQQDEAGGWADVRCCGFACRGRLSRRPIQQDDQPSMPPQVPTLLGKSLESLSM
jgi:hypothetical protein